ncbi:exonuclease SbcCD subunit D [Oribacterium sp. P6A1]|uniref:exonuclease SbcCD subunit D n=1 Tax=Oribacterium sp. P6A1 TaxID=1410612 RepID=UPI00068BCD3F|nr:exonuclease SbcCD subunit D [Oribacterium sp. P6A1]
MKLLHLGDLHLGKYLGDFDLIADQEYILNQIIDLIDKESVDAVLIAGDVYDKSIPSESATRLLDRFLNQLAKRKVSTFLISGNHDSDDRLNYGSTLFESSGIYISAIFSGHLDKRVLRDGDTELNIYLLPFVKASQVRHFFPDKKIDNYEDAVRVILEDADIDKEKCNVLVAHQFVAGKGEDPALGGSESAGTQSVGLVEKIAYDLFDEFDYVALGHIHSPQRVGRDEVRYSGSPLKYSLSEVNNEKSVPIITMDEKKNVAIELFPLKPLRDMRHIKGKMEKLLDKANVSSTEDFIYATLTDEDIINDAMGIFQQTYPNTVKIDYDNAHTREIEQVDISKIAQNRSFTDLISDFYKTIYGCEISDEEMDVMRMAAREAGVINETD